MGYLELLLSINVKQCCIGRLSLNRESEKENDVKRIRGNVLLRMEKVRLFALHNVSEFGSEASSVSVAERAES